MISPNTMYARLNKLLWLGRLPKCCIVSVSNSVMPKCRGISFDDNLLVKPVIFLNSRYKLWGKTLVHEMVHIAEPQLMHGIIFNSLVEFYWQIAKEKFKELDGL